MNLSKKQTKQIYDYYVAGGGRFAYCQFFGIPYSKRDINVEDIERFLQDFQTSYNKYFGYTF